MYIVIMKEGTKLGNPIFFRTDPETESKLREIAKKEYRSLSNMTSYIIGLFVKKHYKK